MSRRKKIAAIIWLFAFFVTGFPDILSGASHNKMYSFAGNKKNRVEKKLPRASGRLLVKFRPQTMGFGVQGADLIAEVGARVADEIPGLGVQVVDLPEGADEEAFARSLSSRPEVEFVEPDYLIPLAATPNDPNYSAEWHLPKISAPGAWDMTTGTESVTIAVLDTGVDGSHPDLAAKLVPGWNFYDNNADTSDVKGHGTAVAGVAAAASNNHTGVASVAWNCLIMPIRVASPTGYASLSTLANAIVWAADHGARVANLSFAYTNSSTLNSAARYMRSKGGLVVMAAGNFSSFSTAPDNPDILVVSATDGNDVKATFSSYGNYLDLAAPGVSIHTTNRGGGYGSWNGTSFSAPITAGLAALVLSVNPGLDASGVENILKQASDDLGAAGWDAEYGWGRVNAERAVMLARGGRAADTTPPTVSFLSPAPGSAVSGVISVQVAASDNVGLTSVLLRVDGGLVGGNTAPLSAFTWDTTTVTNGAHTLTATAEDAAGNTATAAVSVTVANVSAPPADTTPPTIIITSPADGAKVTGNEPVYVRAADNVGVAKVELYVNGVLSDTSTSAPFTTRWHLKWLRRGPHSLQCVAYDSAGNRGASPVVTVFK